VLALGERVKLPAIAQTSSVCGGLLFALNIEIL